MDIPIGVVGEILEGQMKGRFVEVIPENPEFGSYLVLTHEHADGSGESFDDWVSSSEDLPQFFAEAGWVIRWLA